MEREDKLIAERVMRYLVKESEIVGLHFQSFPQILLSGPVIYDYDISGQVFINIESKFMLYQSMPQQLPVSEDDMIELNEEEIFLQLFRLRNKKIMNIELADSIPHIIITFETGEVLFINGFHDMYESWQLGVSYSDENEHWLVVACPGRGIAVWAPERFINDSKRW